MNRIYSTKEVAELCGIHVNTVRFYEKIGFLTSPARRANGYRSYTMLQVAQCRLIRLAMRAEVLQNGLRESAVRLVRQCAALDFDAALGEADRYSALIDAEIKNARAAVAYVEGVLDSGHSGDIALTRGEAAAALGVTGETLRTWERSGLCGVGRGANGRRVYRAADMDRLNIIRTLRCANYSLTAILRLLNRLDGHTAASVESALDTPEENEDIVSVCDQLITSLNATAADAERLKLMLAEIRALTE